MRKATREWFEGLVDARLVKARAQATFALGSAVGQVTKAVHQVSLTVAARSGELLQGLHEAEDRANERHTQLGAALVSVVAKLDEAVAKLDTLLERAARAENAAKVVRKDLRPTPAPKTMTGLPGPAPASEGPSVAERVLAGEPVDVVPAKPCTATSSQRPKGLIVPSTVLDLDKLDVEWLTVAEAAARVDRQYGVVAAAAKAGKIPGAKQGKGRRWSLPLPGVLSWATNPSA